MKERIKNYEEGRTMTAEQILDQLITSYTSAKRDLIMRLLCHNNGHIFRQGLF